MTVGLQKTPYTLPTETPTEFVGKTRKRSDWIVDKRFKTLIIMNQKATDSI